MKETESHYNYMYSKKFKSEPEKCIPKQKNRGALAIVGTKTRPKESGVKFETIIKSGLLNLERHLSLRKENKIWNTILKS